MIVLKGVLPPGARPAGARTAYNPNPQGQGLTPGVKRLLRRVIALVLFVLLAYLLLIGLWVVLDPRW